MRHSKLKKLILSFLAAAVLVPASGTLAEPAVSGTTYSGRQIIAVNSDISTDNKSSGSFQSSDKSNALLNSSSLGGEPAGVSGIDYDPETGETMYILEPDLPELTPVKNQSNEGKSVSPDSDIISEEVQLDDTRTIYDGLGNTSRSMKCVYIGTYCTVWSCTSDDSSIQISSVNAKRVGDYFDENIMAEVDAFGTWLDADGDGKIAIFCFDISNNYPNNPSSYTAGYFYSLNLASPTTHEINGLTFSTSTPEACIGCDCINLDTYPLMGQSGRLFSRVENSFPTLMHETQHLINFSYSVKNGGKGYNKFNMPTFLNEAFSMAAEHMICGPDQTNDRITYFNNQSKYVPGTSLTVWESSLSNYSNSFLFGQYIRTRYAQLTGSDGNTIFKETLVAMATAAGGNALSIISDTLGTTPQQLITDFWSAVYLKNSRGIFGFNGEAWANSISPKIYSSTSGNSSGIYNGGAKFYSVSISPTSVNNLKFTTIDTAYHVRDEFDQINPSAGTVERTALNKAVLSLSSPRASAIFYKASDTEISDINALTECTYIKAGDVTAEITLPSKANLTLYYCLENGGSDYSIYSVPIPPPQNYSVTVINSDGGTINAPSEAVPGEELTVTVTPDEGLALFYLYVNGERVSTETLIPEGDITLSAEFAPLTDHGTGGGDVNWYLYDSGIMRITCDNVPVCDMPESNKYLLEQSVDMDDFTDDNHPEWYPYRDLITALIIDAGVTHIGNDAFLGCTSLLTVTFSDDVQTIGSNAFTGCTGLSTLLLPDSVTTLGAGAFSGCSSLTNVTLGSGIASVGNNAFSGCGMLYDIGYCGTDPSGISCGEDALPSGVSIENTTVRIRDAQIIHGNLRAQIISDTAKQSVVIAAFYDKNGRQLGINSCTADLTENGTDVILLPVSAPDGWHSCKLFTAADGSFIPICSSVRPGM